MSKPEPESPTYLRLPFDQLHTLDLETAVDLDSRYKCENPECTKELTRAELKFCGKCRRARYCGKECQKAHWSTHKPVCADLVKTEADPNTWSLSENGMRICNRFLTIQCAANGKRLFGEGYKASGDLKGILLYRPVDLANDAQNSFEGVLPAYFSFLTIVDELKRLGVPEKHIHEAEVAIADSQPPLKFFLGVCLPRTRVLYGLRCGLEYKKEELVS